MKLTDSVRFVRGIGPKKAELLEKLGILTLRDALEFYPRGYEDRTHVTAISHLCDGDKACIHAILAAPLRSAHIRKGMDISSGRVYDETGVAELRFFNNRFAASALAGGQEYAFWGKVERNGSRATLINPEFEPVTAGQKTGRILPVYSLTAGIHPRDMERVTGAALEAMPADWADYIPPEILQRYHLPVLRQALYLIHRPQTAQDAELARRRLIFDELFLLACGLSRLRQRRTEKRGPRLRDLSLNAFYKALPFQLTNAQQRAIEECVLDLSAGPPMSRLVQGDVGSGKTMVAAALCWLAARNGKQAALMAPTELLASQHAQSLLPLMQKLDIPVFLLTGSMSVRDKRQTLTELAAGTPGVVIGTHALISEQVQFRNLALAVVDEQHRFGVNQRAALTEKGDNVHVLVMSATPIPRTLALLIYGDLDVSILDELPPGRQAVDTYAVGEDMRPRIDRFIDKQIDAGGQVYVVCPLVEDDGEEVSGGRISAQAAAQRLTKVLPHRHIGLVHGRTKAAEKDAIMHAFSAGQLDLLVATTVIEVGVDVPNANLMVVENGDCFGLSQLHQLRGRVGRGPRKSYCILYGADKGESAKERLRTLCKTADGFRIAQADLELRGAGDFFGTRQHGLPPMKLAAGATDPRLIADAQRAAQQLISVDPELEQHPRLREQVQRLFARCGDGGLN